MDYHRSANLSPASSESMKSWTRGLQSRQTCAVCVRARVWLHTCLADLAHAFATPAEMNAAFFVGTLNK